MKMKIRIEKKIKDGRYYFDVLLCKYGEPDRYTNISDDKESARLITGHTWESEGLFVNASEHQFIYDNGVQHKITAVFSHIPACAKVDVIAAEVQKRIVTVKNWVEECKQFRKKGCLYLSTAEFYV